MTETEPQPSCMFKRRPRQQTKRGNKRSTGTPGAALRTQQCRNSNIPFRLLKMMTAKIWIFPPRLGRADSVDRSSKRSFHGCLTGLATQAPEEHAPLQRSSATGYEDRRLVPHACVPQMLYHLDACAGSVLTPRDCITNVQKKIGNRLWSVPIVWSLLGPTAGTRRDLQRRRSHTRTLRLCSRRLGWTQTRRPRHYDRTQRAHSNAIQAS